MSKTHRYMEISARLSRDIQSGSLPAGEKAPSLREITRQFGVSLGTALQAYEHLEKLGLLRSEPKRGFYVNRINQARLPEKMQPSQPVPSAIQTLPLVDQILSPDKSGIHFSFAAAELDPVWHPLQGLEKALRAVVREEMAGLGSYIPSPGYSPLRQQIALRSFEWGGNLHADEVLITNGATDALSLSLSACVATGGIVAIETPTYFGLLQLLKSKQLPVIEIPTDSRTGMDMEALAKAASQHPIQAVVVSANLQNPFGCSLPDSAKIQLLALARQYGFTVIENDVYGDLFQRGPRPKPIIAFDDTQQVIYCNSFSKTAVPGYRLGWCVGGQYQTKLRQLQIEQDIAVSSLPQLVMYRLLASGDYASHLVSLRERLANQQTAIRQYILDCFPPGTRVSQPEGGFLFWLELPGHIAAIDIYHAAKQAGVLVTPGDLFFGQTPRRNCLRLSCGSPFHQEMKAAIRLLGDICQQMQYASPS